MKVLYLVGVLALAPLFNLSMGHGGTYRGPGDTVPPGGGGGGSGGPSGTPGPSGPTTPGGGGPTTPGATAPGAPPSPGGSSPTTPAPGDTAPDLTQWRFWWGFNKDPYLNLRAKVHAGEVLTGSDEHFMGHGDRSGARDSMAPSETVIRTQIVPALLRALETETQNDILTGAMIALAKIGDAGDLAGESHFESVLAEFLTDNVQEVRETAAIALGILGNPASIETLRDIALDTPAGRKLVDSHEVNFRTRSFAIYGLGLVGYRAEEADRQLVVQTLHSILEEERLSTRDVKVSALIAMGLVPLDTQDLAGDETSDPSLSRRHQIEYVLDLLESDNRKVPFLVRAHAPRTLVQLVTGSIDLTDVQRTQFAPAADRWRTHVATILTDMLGKKGQSLQTELRQGATLALGRLGDAGDSDLSKKTRRVLLEASKNSDQQTKWFARIALAQAGGVPAQSDEPFAATRETEEALVRMLVRGPSRGKPWSALALGVLGHLQSQFGLTPSSDVDIGLRDSMSRITSPQDIGAYAMASALRGDFQAKSGIFAKLQSVSDDTARGELSVALGLLGAREYVDEIQNLVRDSKYRPDLLKQASIALGLLGDKATVSLLTSMLSESESLATQASIATALGFIGDSRSVPPLVELLEDKEQTALARAFAAVALGGVADKETLPWNAKLSADLQYRASTRTLTGQGVGLLDIL